MSKNSAFFTGTKSKAQLELHSEDRENIACPFAVEQIPCCEMSRRIGETLAISSQGKEDLFEVDKNSRHHLLLAAVLNLFLPQITVAPSYQAEYQIRWCDNLFVNSIGKLCFEMDEKELSSFTSKSLEMKREFFFQGRTEAERKMADESCGNCPELTTWSHRVPSYEMIMKIPFFFSDYPMFAFPLRKLYPGIYNTLQFRCQFNSQILKLLKIRKLNESGDRWEEIPMTEEHFSKLLGIPRNLEIPKPSIRCYFVDLEESVAEEFRNCGSELERRYYLEIFTNAKADSRVKLGHKSTVSLRSSNPVRAIMWGALNESARVRGDYSHYLTSSGRVPILHNTLQYCSASQEQTIFNEETSPNFYRGDSMSRFISTPNIKGLLGYVFGLRVGIPDGDSEIEFLAANDYKLICQMEDRQLDPEESDDDFEVNVVLCSLRKIEIVQDPANNGKFLVEIDNWKDPAILNV